MTDINYADYYNKLKANEPISPNEPFQPIDSAQSTDSPQSEDSAPTEQANDTISEGTPSKESTETTDASQSTEASGILTAISGEPATPTLTPISAETASPTLAPISAEPTAPTTPTLAPISGESVAPTLTPLSADPNQAQAQEKAQEKERAKAAKAEKNAIPYGRTKVIVLVGTAVISALVTALVLVLLTNFGFLRVSPRITSLNDPADMQRAEEIDNALKKSASEVPNWDTIFAKVAPSVVSIQYTQSQGTALGSGFILDKSGHVVTNNHVVSGANGSQIQVTLSNGNLYEGKVIGTDPTSDIAVLELQNAPNDQLTPVTFADSTKLAVGDDVMAVGNPLGFSNTATTGIVSALNRPVTAMDESKSNSLVQNNSSSLIVTNAIQVDAAVNPGNSGGPLFNSNAEVIGITSSIAQASATATGSIGIGFAIPSALTQRITSELVSSGKAHHAALGVSIMEGTASNNGVQVRAAKVTKVGDNTPAKKAGMQEGDLVIAVNNTPVSSTYSLMGLIREFALNTQITITVVRGNEILQLPVTLDQEQDLALGSLGNNQQDSENTPQQQDPNQQIPDQGDLDLEDLFGGLFGE